MNRGNSIRAALIAAVVALGCIAIEAAAQTSAYLIDQRGAMVKTPYGLCIRTGYWTPSQATTECDPDLVPKKVTPAPATKPVRTQPPIAPRVPAPRVAPVTQKISLSADALFDFDKAVIRSDARTKLDELVGKLKAVSLDTVIAIGHTDRIGSAKYNLKLSTRRAEAVKAYLVSKGIAANRIHTEGKGSAQPVTKSGQCKGPKSRKIIACLAPDRRVDVEIVGTSAK